MFAPAMVRVNDARVHHPRRVREAHGRFFVCRREDVGDASRMDLRRHDGQVVRSDDPRQPQVTPASPGRARRRRWGALTVFALAGCNGPAAVQDAGTGEAGSMEGGMDDGIDEGAQDN